MNSLSTVCIKFILDVDKLTPIPDVSHETVHNFVSHETGVMCYLSELINKFI